MSIRPASPALFLVAALAALALLATGAAAPAAASTSCAAQSSWVSDPNPPEEIPDDGSDFCDFYQFSWQWFLELVSPSSSDPSIRNFQDTSQYPQFQGYGKDSCGDSARSAGGPALFVRTFKDDDRTAAEATDDFVEPEMINQAGDGAVIYDQNGNVVYYTVVFSENLCAASKSGDLPAGATELKMSWRQIDPDSAAGYFTMEATIDDTEMLLGLVGFHLFRTTSDHPEGVWMTWEHASNVPDCTDPQSTPDGGWSFTSSTCAACLAATSPDASCAGCDFNAATQQSSLTGTPTEICRVYADGTSDDDHEADTNRSNIDDLNSQIDGYLSALASSDPMSVWQNYFLVGGVWVSDPTQVADYENQRGSIQIANTTMETTFQGAFEWSGDSFVTTGRAINCFGCHQYTPNQTATSGLSHIFSAIHGSSSHSALHLPGLQPVRSQGEAMTARRPLEPVRASAETAEGSGTD